MGDHQKSAAGTAQETLQELDCIYVQMVGRLVHDEEIRLRGKHTCKRNPLDLPSGQFLHFLSEVIQGKIREEFLHPHLVLHLVLHIAPVREPGTVRKDLSQDVLLRIEVIVLFQKRNPDVLEKQDFTTGIRLILSREDTHQRSLSRTVGRNEGDLVTLVDIEAYMLEKDLRSVGFGYIFYLKI